MIGHIHNSMEGEDIHQVMLLPSATNPQLLSMTLGGWSLAFQRQYG